MTEKQAIKLCDKLRKQNPDGEWIVVYDPSCGDDPKGCYFTCDIDGLDTFYLGCEVVY